MKSIITKKNLIKVGKVTGITAVYIVVLKCVSDASYDLITKIINEK